MKRSDRIKLYITRKWPFPGKERLANFLISPRKHKYVSEDEILWLANENIAIYGNSNNYIEWTIMSSGTYEDEIGRLINISLKSGENALDIGANIGLQSIRMSQAVGVSGRVYSFEPINYLQKKLENNLELNRATNVQIFPLALSDEKGSAVFQIDPQIWNQGTFSLTTKGDQGESQVVTIAVADELPEVRELTSLHLIKIDVEGFEFQVLRGLKETLHKHHPRLIFEYDADYWLKADQQINDAFLFLQSLNYAVFQITPFGCERINSVTDIEGGNIFCIHHNLS